MKLESGPTCSLIAKLLQRLSLAVHEFCIASKKHCERGYGRMYVKLEARQNSCSYVCELSGPTFNSPCKNLACIVGGYKEDLKKISDGGGVGACPGHYGSYMQAQSQSSTTHACMIIYLTRRHY